MHAMVHGACALPNSVRAYNAQTTVACSKYANQGKGGVIEIRALAMTKSVSAESSPE
jgi:hypothetical protein|eukprot:COSAG01_NODE_18057_length_1103_cov_1.311753_2_plen_57_part_00